MQFSDDIFTIPCNMQLSGLGL